MSALVVSVVFSTGIFFGGCPVYGQVREGVRPALTYPNCAKECHTEITGRQIMHGPAQSQCEACHIQGSPDQHKFYFVVPEAELCQRCHVLPRQAVAHVPVRDGRCMECHDPHGSSRPRMLIADPSEICTKCHQRDFAKEGFVHGPVAVGACIVCHEPHSSTRAHLVNADPQELCRGCHAEVDGESGSHRHAALDQGCTECHDPHASEHRYQLVADAPDLCLSCHREHMETIVDGARVVHGAMTAKGGCVACHEPHSSVLPSLQRAGQKEVCLECHDAGLDSPAGLTDMATLLAKNPDHHGPIREGACTACHEPHAANHFRLLVEDYPAQFYAPFNIEAFRLCFKCHISDLVLKVTGRGLTQFRDGDQNLHYLHVNQAKGRTCRACHEVHASSRPSHIREAVPFGDTGWMLEINFQATQEGGSCAPGCHAPRSYDRNKPAAAAAAKNAGAQK